ncbi:MAG: TMEM43 family protein [Lactobacillaceae bacterium]|jgi:hypothetical protein|nr:TMEM43 family protein [Lactobacillaceae bacterium]
MNNNTDKNKDEINPISSIIGIMLFIPSLLLLFGVLFTYFNEGGAYKMALGETVSVSSSKIDQLHDGKLVHIVGEAQTNNVLEDDIFPVFTKSLTLTRNVEMYQWYKSGTRRFSYSKKWFSYPIHNMIPVFINPLFPFFSQTKYADDITIGSFKMSSADAKDFFDKRLFPRNKYMLNHSQTPAGYYVSNNIYHTIDDIQKPKIGDLIVEFLHIPVGTMTIIGEQRGEYIIPHKTKYGNIALAAQGVYSFQEILTSKLKTNDIVIWAALGSGIIMLLLGFFLSKPLFIKIMQKLKEQ